MIEKLKLMNSVGRDIFSNDINIIRKYKNNLKLMLKECRYNRNKTDRGLEEKINTLVHEYDIKREVLSVVSWMELIIED